MDRFIDRTPRTLDRWALAVGLGSTLLNLALVPLVFDSFLWIFGVGVAACTGLWCIPLLILARGRYGLAPMFGLITAGLWGYVFLFHVPGFLDAVKRTTLF